MLQIKTTNGETLIHADQRPDTYNGRSYDGSQYMVHAGEWGHHKYIRKEGNRYIYPEDLQKKARAGVQKVQQKAKEVYDDRKIYGDAAKNMASDGAKVGKKVAKAVWDSSKVGKVFNQGYQVGQEIANYQNSKKDEAQVTRGGATKQKSRPVSRKRNVVEGGMDVKIKDKRTTLKQIEKDKRFKEYSPNNVRKDRNTAQQLTNAHQNSTARDKEYENLGGYIYRDGEAHRKNGDLQSASVKKQIAKTAERKQKAYESHERDSKQITNAHQTSTKKYGDNGYLYQDTSLSDKGFQTENLKKQKTKTAARKIEREEKERKRAKVDQQRKSAHAGYEADKKLFPDGGSTEELEIQKRKTKDRKIDKKSKEILSKGFKGNRK